MRRADRAVEGEPAVRIEVRGWRRIHRVEGVGIGHRPIDEAVEDLLRGRPVGRQTEPVEAPVERPDDAVGRGGVDAAFPGVKERRENHSAARN
jgi:hypothetical protein